MTGNKEKLDDFMQIKGGIVKFGGGDGRISGKGTIRTSKLDFENVYYVEELRHFNLIPRKCDLYTFSISELQPEQNVTCLVAKASLDESTRWHRRMAHVNFKTINKLAKEGLVDGLPLKVFTNEHNCVAPLTSSYSTDFSSECSQEDFQVSKRATKIRHHFIRDANEKNLIQVLKIHTDDNVADLLTKAFDGPFLYILTFLQMDMLFFLLEAMDSAGSRREIGVSPFADSAASSSPSNVSTDHIPINVLFESTSGGILEFFLDSDEEERIGMSRLAADPDSDDEVLAEIIFRGKSILGDGVVLVDKLPDDE
ncbi:putative ribonuclease H-like domain-containing protein, partial [Tanacetum coccineum]